VFAIFVQKLLKNNLRPLSIPQISRVVATEETFSLNLRSNWQTRSPQPNIIRRRCYCVGRLVISIMC
jgi:hypothetical protein